MTLWRWSVPFVGILAVALWAADAWAQAPACIPFRVNPSFTNVLQEHRENAVYIDMLEAGDIACVRSHQLLGGKQWGHVLFKVVPNRRERIQVDGWTLMQSLTAMRPPHELMPPAQEQVTGDPPSADQAPPAPDAVLSGVPANQSEEIVRFDQPIPFGPVPVNGHTLAELTDSIPLFPPIKEAENGLWQKKCSSCHKWERTSLCQQGEVYKADPRSALRQPHPFGGPFKVALMRWAKNGCQ